MRNIPALLSFLLAGALGCSTAAPGGEATDSGLEGLVNRGPTQPVCVVELPCDEPFAALFHVAQDGREIATFRSDAQGQFSIALPPGDYVITPDASAPIIFPTRQAKTVRVEPNGMTRVELGFDTGIR
jgi:hypothetical protein